MSDDEENNNETKVGQTRIYRPIYVSLDVAVAVSYTHLTLPTNREV